MSNKLQALLALANDAAELAAIDMSETSTGGGERKLLEEGVYLGRFVEYIELGKHAREYQGKPKPAALSFRLGFGLFGEGVQYDDGNPFILRTYDMTLGNNEKAKAKIAFDALNYEGKAKHFAQLLGNAYLVYVTVETSKAGKQYNQINFHKCGPAFEPISKQWYDVPEAPDEAYRLFLWDNPTQETWDALYIDGVIEGGERAGQSKNYIQEMCLAAVDFQGSPLHQLLGGGELTLPEAAEAPAEEATEEEAPEVPAVPKVPAAPKAPPVPKAPAAPKAATPPVPKAATPKAPAAPAVKAPPVPKVK